MSTFWIIVVALWLAGYVGCWLRVLPVPVMRVWFTIGLAVNILICSLNAYWLDLLRFVGVPRTTTQWLVAVNCRIFFALAVHWSPQIRVHIDESTGLKWSDVPLNSAMCCNHTSFMDAFLFVAQGPWHYITYCKTLMKASLRKIPIFGGVFDRVGHFPVYFKSGADNDFSVDKEKQEAVMSRVKKHIDAKLPLALFPEGAVNSNPRELKTFRRGSFALMIEYRMPIYCFIAVGNAETWPSSAPTGGFPADIFVSVQKFDVDYDTMDAAVLADALQKKMQAEVDRLYAKFDAANKGVPSAAKKSQ